jgi:hypothetical protein
MEYAVTTKVVKLKRTTLDEEELNLYLGTYAAQQQCTNEWMYIYVLLHYMTQHLAYMYVSPLAYILTSPKHSPTV